MHIFPNSMWSTTCLWGSCHHGDKLNPQEDWGFYMVCVRIIRSSYTIFVLPTSWVLLEWYIGLCIVYASWLICIDFVFDGYVVQHVYVCTGIRVCVYVFISCVRMSTTKSIIFNKRWSINYLLESFVRVFLEASLTSHDIPNDLNTISF